MMEKPRLSVLVLLVIVLLSASSRAAAQDKGDSGISMGYPASIGFVFYVADRVALRPEITFSRATTDQDTQFGGFSSESTSVSVGISGLVYVGRWDRVQAYVSPGYTYHRADGSVDSPIFPTTDSSTLTGHTFRGSFGAQYSLHERFSVFGESGLESTIRRSDSDFSPVERELSAFGSRAAVGVVFYF
jgi:Outer membrane protein beta-barrel domain